MKKALILTFLAVLVMILISCDDELPFDDGITWTITQFGGIAANGDIPAVSSTHILIKFSEEILFLGPNEISIEGAAILDPDPNRGIGWREGNICEIPIIAVTTGLATVKINKNGITSSSKTVQIYKDMSIIVIFDKNNNDPESTEANPKFKTVLPSTGKIDSLPSEPTRTGYTFTGWKDAAGSVFTDATNVTVNTTVFAQWSINQYTITFDANTATGDAPAAITGDYNTVITLPNAGNLAKPEHVFIGWNTQANKTGLDYSAGVSYTITNNVKLYAQWGDKIDQLLAEVFDPMNIPNPIFGRVLAHNAGTPLTVTVPVRGSVINYMFEPLEINTSRLLPICPTSNPAFRGVPVYNLNQVTGGGSNNPNNVNNWGTKRPGAIMGDLKYIIYHDTANTGSQYRGDAEAHAQLLQGTFTASWHYSVDTDNIFQSIPENEVAWHGGSLANLHAIGIESCVNYGAPTQYTSDFYRIWQRTAKLMAFLLDKFELPLTAVLSHREISQMGMATPGAGYTYSKCCPMTLRHAGFYGMAKEMIKNELTYLHKIAQKGYSAQIIIDPDSTEYLDAKGRVLKLPSVQTTVSYTVRLTTPEGTREKRYSSVLPAQSSNGLGVNYITACDLGTVCERTRDFTSIPNPSIIRTKKWF